RINELITENKMTLSSFAAETKINPSTINHIINGRNDKKKGKVNQPPSTDVITKILSTFPDISPEWLLMGTGPKYKGQRAVIQPDLFTETAIKPFISPVIPEDRKEIETQPEEKDVKITTKRSAMPELSLSENIDKIVIFFKNKTYVTLKPEEE
ncbi:MAG: helix-turn-helix domain-containing protein, partial [Tannerella sp.]|nr:helix-turn-helix domain-containing protein [Tannerella sp.]